jgi:ankyrin repeat protein
MNVPKILLGTLCSMATVWAADVTPARIRGAAAKAVIVLQNGQKTWYAKQSCVSCHQQVFPALAFRAAREHGIPVDEPAALADAQAGFRFYSNLERAVEYTYVIDPSLGDGYSLIGADAVGVRPNVVTAVYARLIAARQEADGRWETIDVRPPQSYSVFSATAISVHAIQLYGHPSQRAEMEARTARAKDWLLSHQPRATEERASQLVGAKWAGADEATLQKIAAGLKATQQDDGGWNSLDGRSSDAYSTSRAMLALHDAGGVATTDPVWRRGLEYLLTTQAADGTWHVESRLHPPAPVSPQYLETGHPYGHDQFVSAMGESLAVIALTTALGPGKPSSRFLTAAEPAGVEPWAETLLFGGAADLKKLLAGGFDPNSATKSGGLTALMLATPDTEKMKILLEHGVNADARAKNRFSALLVAAQYTDSNAAINLLLDHGAKVRLPKGQGAPFFNAFPVMLAAMAGNSEIIGRLLKEGDRVDDKMNVVGFFPVTPMLFLATSHRTNCVSALLDAGAKVDEVDGDGITSLSWAAISNRVEMARLLISRGADVNHVDKKGMTPLLYAASIDFGDSEMIDLLLKSGAHADARNSDGLTALDLARKYKHTHLLPSLEGLRASR